MPANIANQPKCSAASSGDFETTGRFRRRPITSATCLERHALFGDRVERPAFGAALEGESVDAGRVEPVYGRPAIGPLADIGGDALLARNVDETRYEAMVAVAMHRRRQAAPTVARTPRAVSAATAPSELRGKASAWDAAGLSSRRGPAPAAPRRR